VAEQSQLIAEQMQLPVVAFEGNMIPLAHWHCGAELLMVYWWYSQSVAAFNA
jgi:hypothetical protein